MQYALYIMANHLQQTIPSEIRLGFLSLLILQCDSCEELNCDSMGGRCLRPTV